MAVLTPQTVPLAGLSPNLVAAGSDTVNVTSDRMYLVIRNAHATNTSTVTIVVPGSAWGQAKPDVVLTIAALTERFFWGPLAAELADASTGVINVNTTGTGTPTIAVVAF
jgi:hypothetical protein